MSLRYHGDRNRIWVPAAPIGWDNVATAGTLDSEGDSSFGAIPGVLLADGLDRSSNTPIDVPDDWNAFYIHSWLVVTNGSISAGDWLGQVEIKTISDGADIGGGYTGESAVSYGAHPWGGGTARGSVHRIDGGVVSNTPGQPQWIVFRRQANAVADTLSGDLLLYGFELVR